MDEAFTLVNSEKDDNDDDAFEANTIKLLGTQGLGIDFTGDSMAEELKQLDAENEQLASLADMMLAQMEIGSFDEDTMDNFYGDDLYEYEEPTSDAMHGNLHQLINVLLSSVLGPMQQQQRWDDMEAQPASTSNLVQELLQQDQSTSDSSFSMDDVAWIIITEEPEPSQAMYLNDNVLLDGELGWNLVDASGSTNWNLMLLLTLLAGTVAMLVFFVYSWAQLRAAMQREVIVPIIIEHEGQLTECYMVLPSDSAAAAAAGKQVLELGWPKDEKHAKGCGNVDEEKKQAQKVYQQKQQEAAAAIQSQPQPAQQAAPAGGVVVAAEHVEQL